MLSPAPGYSFETGIADRAYHESREQQNQHYPAGRPAPILDRYFPGVYHRSDHARSRGTGHANEIGKSACGRHPMQVKARKAPATAEGERQAHQPSQVVNMPRFGNITLRNGSYPPGVGQDCRCNTETHHVGQGIELLAEFGIRMSRTSDKSIESIKDDGETHLPHGLVEVDNPAFDRRQHGIESA